MHTLNALISTFSRAVLKIMLTISQNAMLTLSSFVWLGTLNAAAVFKIAHGVYI